MFSVFGSTGFIGSNWMKLHPDISYGEPRESISPKNNKLIYFRGTNTNYNIFKDPLLDINTNLVLFTETLKNLRNDAEFNLISSWFVHHPKGFYSATKLCQEMLLESYCKTFNIKYRILRLSNVIGGDSGNSAKKNAFEFIINKLKINEDVNIYDGDNYRNYLHVEDCCRAIKLVTEKGDINSIYEIGDTESYKLIDLVNYAKDLLKSKSNINIIDTPEFHKIVQIKDFWMNTEKLYELGFQKRYNIFDTISILCNKI